MLVTFVVGVVVVFFAYLVSLTRNPRYLFVSFIILFFYLALRYDFGNDYMNYYNIFDDIKRSNWSEVYRLANVNQFGQTMEFGYIYLNKVFSSFTNFYFFIAFQSFIFCIVYYQLIVKHVNYKYLWLSLFILIFHTSLLVRSISGLRQALAIFSFIYAIQYLINRDILRYSLFIIIAILFHYSAVLLFPLYFVISNKRISRTEPIIYLGLYFIVLFFGEILLTPIEYIVINFLPKYNFYIQDKEANTISSGFGLIANTILYVIILFKAKKDNPADRVFYRLAAVFMIISPISLIIINLARLSLYFAPALIVVIPNMMIKRSSILIKRVALVMAIFLYMLGAYRHYTGEITVEKNYHYKTILSSI